MTPSQNAGLYDTCKGTKVRFIIKATLTLKSTLFLYLFLKNSQCSVLPKRFLSEKPTHLCQTGLLVIK